MAFDHIAEARSIAAELTSSRYVDGGELIQGRIDFASTGTELVIGVYAALRELIASEPDLPEDLKAWAQRLAEDLGRL